MSNSETKKASPIGVMENVKYVLKDKHGNVKPLFVANEEGLKYMKENGACDLASIKSGSYGELKNEMVISNLVVNAGLAGAASRINGAGAEAAFTFIELGTGTTAANATDTALETAITTGGGARAAATASRVTTTVTNDTAQLLNTFNFTASFAITESGVLNATSAGTMLARQVFSVINVTNGDSLQITWKFAAS